MRCRRATVDARSLPLAAMTTEPRSLLDELLCTALAVGLVLVLVLPSARGMSAAGWLPLWLVGMPAVAWWALRGFPLPSPRSKIAVRVPSARPRHAAPQARRSIRTASGRRVRAAA